MSDRNLADLQPEFQPLVTKLLEQANAAFAPLKVIVTDGKRSFDEQKHFYGKGRTPSDLTATGKYTPQEAQDYADPPAAKITWTLDSYHLRGLAVDIAFVKDGQLTYDADYGKLAEIGKSLGLEAGYYWKTQDKPHFQLTNPISMPDPIDPWRLKIRAFVKQQGLVGDVDGFVAHLDADKVLVALVNACPELKAKWQQFNMP